MSINYRALQPRADVDRLYVSRREGSKEMVSIEQSVKIEECSMSDYLRRTCIYGDTILNTFLKDKTAVELMRDKVTERNNRWKGSTWSVHQKAETG